MRSRPAIAQYEATIVLVVISLSLASVVYEGLRRQSSLNPAPVFVDQITPIGGNPSIDRLALNSSVFTEVSSLSVDSATSSSGVLALSDSGYSTTRSLCAAGETTFFSILAPQAGMLEVATNGMSWISGVWGTAVPVSRGWHEVMIQGATSCSITLPGGEEAPSQWVAGSSVLSSIPADGDPMGTAFTFFIPIAPGPHAVLVTTTGGFADVEV